MSIAKTVPSTANLPGPASVASSGGGINSGESAAEARQPNATQSKTQRAAQKRAAHPQFVLIWSLESLQPRLPLRFAVDPKLPLSTKLHYRSQYRYLDFEVLLDSTKRATLSDFQIVVYIVDFSGLEAELAQGYLGGHKGQVPFHPVSMFLAICLRLELGLSWKKLSRLLRGRDGGHWRQLFGFADNQTPSTSGLRYFYHHVMGREVFDNLCQRLVTLLRHNDLVPTESTYPDDPPGRGISVTQDGMLHQARHAHCCQLATDECFQPLANSVIPATPMTPAITELGQADPTTSPPSALPLPMPEPQSAAVGVGTPDPGAAGDPLPKRPCRARERGHEGCHCDTPECWVCCQRASQLDPDARFQHYSGHNHKHGKRGKRKGAKSPEKAMGKTPGESGGNETRGQGTNCFGYRSVADRQLDDRFAVAWTLQSQVYSANTDERTIFRSRSQGLEAKYPGQKIGEWIDDSGVGYEDCLRAIHELGALRMIDIRAAPEDADPAACLRRGYDGQGRPLCHFGYPLRSNGYDYQAQRAKYVCAGVCRRQPLHEGEPVSPVKDCPYLPKLGDSRSLGQVMNVGLTMPDGSTRLARDIPYGSQAWNARYGRRNNSESRNGQLEGMGLKRMISHGTDHVRRDTQLADFILDLRTMGRLVREATDLQKRDRD